MSIHIVEGGEAETALQLEGGAHTVELVTNLVRGIAAAQRKNIKSVFEQSDVLAQQNEQKQIDWNLTSVTTLAAQGNMIVALQDGKPVGMAGMDRAGIDPNTQREVWKVVRLSVLPEARGHKLSSQLIRTVIQRIREQHPGADILITTEDHELLAPTLDRWKIPRTTVERMLQIRYNDMDYRKHEANTSEYDDYGVFLLPSGQALDWQPHRESNPG